LAAEDAREAADATEPDPKAADATATDAEEPDPKAAASEEGRAPSRRGPDYSVPSSIDLVADPVLYAMSTRRSISKVDPETPCTASRRAELLRAAAYRPRRRSRPPRPVHAPVDLQGRSRAAQRLRPARDHPRRVLGRRPQGAAALALPHPPRRRPTPPRCRPRRGRREGPQTRRSQREAPAGRAPARARVLTDPA